MAQNKKQDEGLLGTGIDTRTAIGAAQLGTNLMGHFGNPVAAGLEYVSAGMDRDDCIKQSLQLMGDGTNVSSLRAGSPAFKKYVKELAGLEEERLSSFTVGIIGGAVAMGIAGMIFGLPGGFLGMLLGLAIGAGGAFAANGIKDHFFPGQDNMFLNFASQLQQMGQQQQMTPEAAFVALAMNMPDERSKRNILISLPNHYRIKRARDMVKLLDSEDGREALRQAMIENDTLIRAGTGAMSAMPKATIAEELANIVNNGQMAGVDLLNLEKTSYVGTLLAMRDIEMAQQSPQSSPQSTSPQLPQQQLPAQRGQLTPSL